MNEQNANEQVVSDTLTDDELAVVVGGGDGPVGAGDNNG
jgi:bacteriocin-like protein